MVKVDKKANRRKGEQANGLENKRQKKGIQIV